MGGRKLRQLCLPSGVRALSVSPIPVQLLGACVCVCGAFFTETCQRNLQWNLEDRNSQERGDSGEGGVRPGFDCTERSDKMREG